MTIGANNFVDKNPFLINWAPMESQDSQLSIDTKIIENGALSTKLQSLKVNGRICRNCKPSIHNLPQFQTSTHKNSSLFFSFGTRLRINEERRHKEASPIL